MRAELVCVGTELLTGLVSETNSAYMAGRLVDAGIDPAFVVTVGDDVDDIGQAVGVAAARAGVVLLTGGLGPTHDDLTRQGLAKAAGTVLESSDELLGQIEAFFQAKNRRMKAINRVQALLPQGARAIANPLGTAPGIRMEIGAARIYALPGVPGEMQHMFDHAVLPELKELVPAIASIRRAYRTAGVGESDIAERIAGLQPDPGSPGGLRVSILAAAGQVVVGLHAQGVDRADAEAALAGMEQALVDRLGPDLVGMDNRTLESVVVEAAASRGLTLAIAESFTGGMVSSRLVSVPGASEVLHTTFVTYASESKIAQLGIPRDLLDRYGAVSREVAIAMAEGARRACGVSLGLSTTGEAGPEAREKPVGTVFIGLAWEGGSEAHELVASGDRAEIRATGCTAALDTVRRWMADHPAG